MVENKHGESKIIDTFATYQWHFPPHVWQLMSLFRAVDALELLALDAGCGAFFVVETLEPALIDGVARIEEFWADGVDVEGDENRLLAALLAENLASSCNVDSASRA